MVSEFLIRNPCGSTFFRSNVFRALIIKVIKFLRVINDTGQFSSLLLKHMHTYQGIAQAGLIISITIQGGSLPVYSTSLFGERYAIIHSFILHLTCKELAVFTC